MFFFEWLLSFCIMFSKHTQCCSLYQYFIPIYRKILFHCMNILHFIHPVNSWWISGLLPSFGFYESCCYEYLCTCVFISLHYLGVELLGHMVTLCLIFWGSGRLFSKVTTPFYIPTSSAWGFQFFHILANTYYYVFLFKAILVVWSGISMCVFF